MKGAVLTLLSVLAIATECADKNESFPGEFREEENNDVPIATDIYVSRNLGIGGR